MAKHPAAALREAVLTSLRADTGLTTLLKGKRVFDTVPPRTAHPFVAYGPASCRDWSTSSSSGHEHAVEITVLSREPGSDEAAAILEAIEARLTGTPLVVADHRVVLLRVVASGIGRERDGQTTRGRLRLRVLSERL
jgi:hypothetical protein